MAVSMGQEEEQEASVVDVERNGREYNVERTKAAEKRAKTTEKRLQTMTKREPTDMVGRPTTSGRHNGNKGFPGRRLPPTDCKRNQGSKQRIQASVEQLKRRARAWFGIKIRPLNSLLSLSFSSLVVIN
ncbi:hypothetical protein M9H77_23328 [Catharanthus roseus]|uniref:Uncharacterized protein n=1 Tax=Catharanthus roseus TaxID=4058 RepID=A0ACC0AUI9_CATRO|nr:hypothetical protein M9H77_23328 [Catharanthus roseus]